MLISLQQLSAYNSRFSKLFNYKMVFLCILFNLSITAIFL